MDAGRAAGDLEPPASTSKSPGELLREERTRRKLSIQQAAEDLHLDVRSVEAIESDDFQALGPPVYAKGHLRNYAALLGLGPEFIVARYLALQDVPEVPTQVPAWLQQQPRPRASIEVPWPLVWSAVGVLVVAFAAWKLVSWFLREPAAGLAASTAPVAAMQAAQAASQPAPETAATPLELQLEFISPSWAEVYDGAGERLMYGMGQKGQLHEFSASAPVHVVLGVATAVQMRINGKDVPVPRQGGREAARFEIAADASLL